MKKYSVKRIVKRLLLCAVAIVGLCIMLLMPQFVSDTTAITSYLANTIFSHNLHEVVPGKFYRSAEMPRDDLEKIVREHKIKTVLDLRLSDDQADKHGRTEEQAANAAGAKYVHIPLNAGRGDQLPQIQKLLEAYEHVERPILAHCSSGTHRAGMASAIWLLDQEKASFASARDQLTAKYGFFQFERDLKAFIQRRPTLDRILSHYEEDTAEYKVSFRAWMKIELSEYDQLERAAAAKE